MYEKQIQSLTDIEQKLTTIEHTNKELNWYTRSKGTNPVGEG